MKISECDANVYNYPLKMKHKSPFFSKQKNGYIAFCPQPFGYLYPHKTKSRCQDVVYPYMG